MEIYLLKIHCPFDRLSARNCKVYFFVSQEKYPAAVLPGGLEPGDLP
jgi:hypothetical protein